MPEKVAKADEYHIRYLVYLQELAIITTDRTTQNSSKESFITKPTAFWIGLDVRAKQRCLKTQDRSPRQNFHGLESHVKVNTFLVLKKRTCVKTFLPRIAFGT